MGLRTAFIGLLLAAAAAPVGATVGPSLTVMGSEVRFEARAGRGSRVSVKGDLLVGPRMAAFDPYSDPIYIRMGSVVLLDVPTAPERSRVRATRTGWRIDYRGDAGNPVRSTLRLSTATGLFSLKAKGLDGASLRAAGPDGVSVQIAAAGELYESSVDYEERGERRWSFRFVPAPPGPPGPPGGGTGGGSITTLAKGDYSGITTLRFEIVRDDAAWAALWAEHAGGTPPAVDFSRDMVVGLWLGPRPSGGYTVEFLRMVVPYTIVVGGWCPPPTDPPIGAPCFGGEEVSGFLVDARETQYGDACLVTGAITYPFVIARVPRVEGPGTYSYSFVTRSCP